MEFIVDLRSEEYRRAMIWHQFASSLGKRVNDWLGWAILAAVPLTILLLLIFVPDALSFWFWPVALLALLYSAYSTLFIRRQISRQAAALLQTNPALAHTCYHLHAKGMKLTDAQADEETNGVFFLWKEVERVAETPESFLFFVSDENILIVPKRCISDAKAFRRLLDKVGKTDA